MPTEDKVYQGDIGTIIEADAEKDLTGVSTLRMDMIKPDGTTAQWGAAIKSGDVQKAQHTTILNDLDQTGMYRGNLYAEWSPTQKWHGDTFRFYVFPVGK